MNFKSLCLSAAMLTLGGSAMAQNPIIRDQFSADPTARLFNGKIYLFPSHDIDPNTAEDYPRKDWFCMNDYHVFSSDNLTDWTDHGKIIDQKDVPWGNPTAYSMWAPDCVQGKDGKYYFYFPDATKEGRGFGIGVAVAEKPEGPYTVLEKNIEGINGIDPCVLQASDGNNYIFWGAGNCAKLKDNMIELAEDNPTDTIKFGPRQFIMKGVNCLKGLPSRQAEGPFAFEHNGNYYLTYPYVRENTEVLAYAMSKNPMGPYEYKGLIMEEWPDCWTNHHSIINYKGQWYLFYHHNLYSPKFDKNRSVCADSLTFNEDGTIKQVIPTLRGIGVTDARTTIQIDRFSTNNGAEMTYLDTTNYFDGWQITYKGNASSTYNAVDFGQKEVTTISIRAKAPKGAKIAISDLTSKMPRWGNRPMPAEFADSWGIIAQVDIPASNDFTIVTVPINKSPKGVIDIKVQTKDEREVSVDWIGFDLKPELHSAILQKTQLQPWQKGGFETHQYRNLFAEMGYSQKDIDKKLQDLYDALFIGPDRIYFEVGDSMAYISDVKNHDARTEGMSYGLMIAVQLDKKDVFDRLWRWSKKYMQMQEGPMRGYFRWSVNPDGTSRAFGAASDGELYFITSLIFASNRWGNDTGIDYLAEAQHILNCATTNPDDTKKGKKAKKNDKVPAFGAPKWGPLFDPATKIITFVPGANYTDPSYNIPAFLEVWAKYAQDGRSEYWTECAKASREYLHKAIHPVTGLNPDYSDFDGSLLNNGHMMGDVFRYDSWRVPMNIALDYSWSCADMAWQQAYGHKLQNFLYQEGIDSFVDQYNVDGTTPTDIMPAGGYKELRHTPGFVATSAALSLVCSHSKSREFVDRFWNSKHEPFPSGYFDAYYEGILRLFAFMHLSGNYRVIEPAQK
ncbi:MAG: glycosyl hydrolase family 8 [Salinivirgaceae bacterium]|nr:glycosyl hydrolase family 8 [Salinivirgaceae bacterium]